MPNLTRLLALACILAGLAGCGTAPTQSQKDRVTAYNCATTSDPNLRLICDQQ